MGKTLERTLFDIYFMIEYSCGLKKESVNYIITKHLINKPSQLSKFAPQFNLLLYGCIYSQNAFPALVK